MDDLIFEFARRLMNCPAAPYHETLVAQEVLRICAEHHLEAAQDPCGNLLVTVRRGKTSRPLVLAAHMDHPGFTQVQRTGRNVYSAVFQGGVTDNYFKEGTKLRLMPGHISARLGKRLSNAKREFAIESEAAPSAEPEFAVWNLPDFELRKGHIRGRACDDLIGVAVALAVLAHQQRQDAALHLIAAITRAEEVGFHGALALATGNLLPRNSLIISLETSRELPPAKMGEGVIIRTGDRASVFSSAGSRFLAEIAAGMNRSEGDFKYQRALMSGGTCEATAYQENGFECAAVCVALGNYHNCGAGNKIAAEFVSAADVSNMARLLSQAAVEMARWKEIVGRLPKRLADYQREAVRALKKQRLVL